MTVYLQAEIGETSQSLPVDVRLFQVMILTCPSCSNEPKPVLAARTIREWLGGGDKDPYPRARIPFGEPLNGELRRQAAERVSWTESSSTRCPGLSC